jgi:hypothetical protein
LDQRISEDTKPGQIFTARVAEPFLDPTGEPIVPADATLLGRVANIRPGKGGHPAEVDLVVDRLLVRGVEHPIEARIVAGDVPAAPVHRRLKGSYVGGGAALGALVGAIAGGWMGAAIGGLAGAGVGVAVSLGMPTGATEPNIPEGTAFVVQLDKSIPVAALRAPRPAER